MYISTKTKKREMRKKAKRGLLFIILGLSAALLIAAAILLLSEIDARKTPELLEQGEDIHLFSMPTPALTPTPLEPFGGNAPISPTPSPEPANTHKDAVKASPSPTPKPSTSPSAPKGDFSIKINKKSYAVKIGVTEKIIEKYIGWMESSAEPGKDGTCVLMGHRNTQFRVLKDVVKGEKIILTDTAGNEYTYTVLSAKIVKEDEPLLFEAQSGKTLTLVTCYPFYYSGHAPHKYVVTAKIA